MQPIDEMYSIDNAVDDSVKLFNGMLRTRPRPLIRAFAKVISSLIKTNQYLTALSLWKEMKLTGIKPDLIAYNILINWCGYLG